MSVDFYDLAVPGVQKLVPYVPGKPIEELERELGLTDIVKLASNENPQGINPSVERAIYAMLPNITRYPDGNGFRLKHALADKLSVTVDQITLGNGSNEILELVARTFLTPELEVVFAEHAFAVYPLVTCAVGAKAKVVAAKEFAHDLAAMADAVNANTRIVFIANPNNPTGTLLNEQSLLEFLEKLPATVLCVLDEAYYEYVDSTVRTNTLSWLDRYPNLIVTRTFSKAYGLAGLRVGYALSSPAIADLLNRVRQPFNNNMLALCAAETALQDHSYLERTVASNRAGMQQLTAAFEKLGLAWIESAGNFVALDLQRPAQPCYERLLRQGVIVRPVANYGMPNHLRVSIGKEEENRKFILALESALDDV